MEQISLVSRQKKLLRILQSQNRVMTGLELAAQQPRGVRNIKKRSGHKAHPDKKTSWGKRETV